MSALLSARTVLDYLALGEDEAGAPQAVALAGQVEALLVAQCGRTGRGFQAAQPGRIEKKDGTGNRMLWLDYPVTTLTTVKLGFDATAPVTTLSPSDPTVLVWGAGSRRLMRSDGGIFGAADAPSYVEVTYDAAAFLPDDAALAVLRVTASVWRQRGAEDVSTERVGGYSGDLVAVAESDPLWKSAVHLYRALVL